MLREPSVVQASVSTNSAWLAHERVPIRIAIEMGFHCSVTICNRIGIRLSIRHRGPWLALYPLPAEHTHSQSLLDALGW